MKFQITPRRILLAVLVLGLAVLVLANWGGGAPVGQPISTQTAPAAEPAGSSAPAPADPSAAGPAASTAADDDEHDDGVASDPPSTVTPTRAPEVQEAATAFAASWLNTFDRSAEQWRSGLLPRVTVDLADELTHAEPGLVPRGGKAGQATVTVDGALHNADVPVVAAAGAPEEFGVLTLTLVRDGDTWLVSEIDWEEAQ